MKKKEDEKEKEGFTSLGFQWAWPRCSLLLGSVVFGLYRCRSSLL